LCGTTIRFDQADAGSSAFFIHTWHNRIRTMFLRSLAALAASLAPAICTGIRILSSPPLKKRVP
jgi:hypothetical protein